MADYETFGSIFPSEAPRPSIEDYSAFKAHQDEQLRKHQEYSEGLKRAEAMVGERQTDLGLVDRVVTALSPTTPTGSRRFLMSELTRHLGVDPKSDGTRAAMGMLSSLDPTSSEVVRRMLVQQSTSAPPGEVKKFLKAVMSGEVPLHELVKQVEQSGRGMIAEGVATAASFASRPGGALPAPMKLGGPTAEETAAAGAAGTPTKTEARGIAPKAAGSDVAGPAREVPMEINRFLPKLDPATPYGYGEVVGHGYRLPGIDKIPKLAEDLATRQNDHLSYIDTVQAIKDQIASGANTGAVGALARFGGFAADQMRQIAGYDVASDGARIDAIGRKISGFIGTGDQDAAVLRSMVIALAFKTAKAQSGTNPTAGEFRAALETIGAGVNSRDAFVAVLDNSSRRSAENYDTFRRSMVGTDAGGIDISPSAVTDKQLRRMVESGGHSPTTMSMIREEASRRKLAEQNASADRAASDDAGAPYKAPRSAEPSRVPSNLEARYKAETAATIKREREVRDREEEAFGFRRASEARAAAEREQSAASFSRSQKWRDEDKARQDRIRAEDKAESRRKDIMAAFQSLAKAISGSVGNISMPSSGGSGGQSGGEASVVVRRRDRQAPQIPQARRSGRGER